MPSSHTLHEPRRILIVRLSALGDAIMTSGLIPALHARFPNAEISWLIEPAAAPLVQDNPKLTNVLIWQRANWRKLWRERRFNELFQAVRAFRRMLRSHQFDLVVDAQGLLKSSFCAWLTGAPRRVVLKPREGSHLLATESVTPPSTHDDPRISAEYRYLAHQLGAKDSDFQLDLPIHLKAAEKVQDLLDSWGQPSQLVALCPFTTRPQKHWFEDQWSLVAKALLNKGYTPIILGGPGDQQAAERLCAQTPGVRHAAGKLKINESVALIARCQLLIGVDTGLTHVGSALKLPTVALFGSTNPYTAGDSPLTRVLYDRLPCSPCHRHPTCHGRFDCMRQLTVDRVLTAAEEVVRFESQNASQNLQIKTEG